MVYHNMASRYTFHIFWALACIPIRLVVATVDDGEICTGAPPLGVPTYYSLGF